MKTTRLFWWTPVLALALLVASASLPVLAQDDGDEAEESGFGDLYAEIETWVAQPVGLDYFPTTVQNPADPYDTRILTFPTGTDTRFRYRAGFELSGNRGGLVLTYFSHKELGELSRASAGNYVFGEILVHPFLAGYYNDGLADAFRSSARTTSRDLRLDYYRTAFKNSHVEAKWFVGWRRVNHSRAIEARYYSLMNDLPPLITNRPDLLPGVDVAHISSDFSGRGVGAGMDFLMPLWKDRISLEGGFSLAVLRGKTDAAYHSTTWAYIDPDGFIMEPPYEEQFNDTVGEFPAIEFIFQEPHETGLVVDGLSSTGGVLEGYIGVRVKAWRELDAFFGFRSTRYDDVGVELRPRSSSLYYGLNLQDLTQVDRSAAYEGFYAGLSYRF